MCGARHPAAGPRPWPAASSGTLLSVLFPALDSPANDRLALSFPDRSLTYAELSDAAHGVARQLAGRRRVAVLAEPRIETCVAVIGGLPLSATWMVKLLVVL